MVGGDESDISGYLDNDRSSQKIEEINSDNESDVTLQEASFVDKGDGTDLVLAMIDDSDADLTDTSEESDSDLKEVPIESKKKPVKKATKFEEDLDNYFDTDSPKGISRRETDLNLAGGSESDTEDDDLTLDVRETKELEVELVSKDTEQERKAKVLSRFGKIKKFFKKNEDKVSFIGDALFRNNVKDKRGEALNTQNKIRAQRTTEKLKKKQEESAVDYRLIKDQEFKRFFMNGLVEKPVKSKIVIFINFFLFFRLGIFDICYLTLGHLPQVQIGILMGMETIFLLMILRAQFKYKLFKTFFMFFRLTWQSVAIWFWLYMAYKYSFKKYTIQENGLRSVEVIFPYDSVTDVRMQWTALFMVFIALFFELLHAFHQVMISVKEWYELKKEGSKLSEEEKKIEIKGK